MMSTTISWLHLSDMHFRVGDNYNANVVSEALLKCFDTELGADFQSIDFIFFTGDIAFFGKRDEYELAAKFFDKLLQRFALQKDKLYVVPGNHDVDWKHIGIARAIGDWINAPDLTIIDRRARVADLLNDPEGRRLMLRRLDGYSSFVNSYFAGHLAFSDDRFFYSKTAKIDETEIIIYGLNSAWFCASDADLKRLVIGERQVRDATSHGIDAAIHIGLVHHPFDWLANFDQTDCEGLLIQHCDFILHGHRHIQAFKQEIRPSGQPFIFASGSTYERRDLPNACNFVKLDLSTGNGKALSLRYSDEHGGFWSRDTQSDPGLKLGEYDFARSRPFVTTAPVITQAIAETQPASPDTRLAKNLIDSPSSYVEYFKKTGKLDEIAPDDIIQVATRSPQDTNHLLAWLILQNIPLVKELITAVGPKLELAMSRSPEDLIKFISLRNEILGPDRIAGEVRKGTIELLLGGLSGEGLTQHLTLQIPKKDPVRPLLAEQLIFSVYLANRSAHPIINPKVSLSTSAPFLSYPYRGGPFVVEPPENWQVSQPNPSSVQCLYDPHAASKNIQIQTESNVLLGTIHMLIPWGEVDGGPIELVFPYRIEGDSFGLVQGQLTVKIVAALSFEEMDARSKKFEVPALSKEGIGTKISIRKGQIIRFAAKGVVSLDSEHHFVNPDGYMCDQFGHLIEPEPGLRLQYESLGELLMGQRAGVVLGWIGDWQEGKAFYIGSTRTITASSEGNLHLAVNDLLGAYGDNSGSFTVTVLVE